jgi:hypothetical protein
MDDFEDLLIDDATWWLKLAVGLRLLADNDARQGALWPVDDFLAPQKAYVACPRRGTHETLRECWACWCDVTGGHASKDDVLRAED